MLPDASSPALHLTHPTPAERIRTWQNSHPEWGPSFTPEAYVQREAFLMTIPTAKASGITHWILTTSSSSSSSFSETTSEHVTLPENTTPSNPNTAPRERPILTTCESLRRRLLLAHPSGALTEGAVHCIGSVFTYPSLRKRGYAKRAILDIREKLRLHQGVDCRSFLADPGVSTGQNTDEGGGDTGSGKDNDQGNDQGTPILGSVLYSDVGKSFYANMGWHAHPSTHLFFPLLQPQPPFHTQTPCAKPLLYHELAPLTTVDETLLKSRLSNPSPSPKLRIALVPDLDVIQWHLMREDFTTTSVLGKTPTVRGAIWSPATSNPGNNGDNNGGRLWMTWTRSYYGDTSPENTDRTGNTLHILRVTVEDEAMAEDTLAQGFAAVMRIALSEADEWRTSGVEMWESRDLYRRLALKSGLDFQRVEREETSIPSLLWFGDTREDIEWLESEKFGWC